MAQTFNVIVLLLYLIGTAIGKTNNYNTLVELNTPLNETLRGIYKKSFSYYSLVHRAPDVFVDMIHTLNNEEFDLKTKEEAAVITKNLNATIFEILDNEPLKKLNSTLPLSLKWNQILDEKFKTNSLVRWFDTEWLFVENYMYARINDIFQTSTLLKNYDPFKKLKNTAYNETKKSILYLAELLISQFSKKEEEPNLSKMHFFQMLKICLWGNRFDLSLSLGRSKNISQENPLSAVKTLDNFILCDQSEKIWIKFNEIKKSKSKRIDFILDNSAYELFTDLSLADYLITNEMADVIVFHGKSIPWYVSDVTKLDFKQFLDQLANEKKFVELESLGNRWKKYLTTGKFIIECEEFWSLPYSYSEMAFHDPELYKQLAGSQLLIFKGDLNYRKLIGDINWPALIPFRQALRGFHPTSIMTLRTLKCDCISGLPLNYEKRIYPGNRDSNFIISARFNWQVSGRYGVIQICK